MILKVHPDHYENMLVSSFPSMTLFLTDIVFPEDDASGVGQIIVSYKPPEENKSKTINIPLRPNTSDLETFDVTMHESPTRAYKMDLQYNNWFSSCFGYDVILAYLGENLRPVLFPAVTAGPSKGTWLWNISSNIPIIGSSKDVKEQITFADCAPYLVVSETSLQNVSARLPDGEEMDISKFRPNIIVEGAESAWEEDFWGMVRLGDVEVNLLHNCVRCQSINIDYATGKPGTGEAGTVLKKLQKDRRVDTGSKYSPVFGRYGFLELKDQGKRIAVGDEATVTKRNSERTKWDWKGLG